MTEEGELQKHGIRIRLPDQSFKVLLALLENPGAVVTRESLIAQLWSPGTLTDFDHGLNAAVNRLREALGDDVARPRFIETLPRRGYRFIAEVENGHSCQSRQQQDAPPRSRARLGPLAVACAFLVAIVAGALWYWSNPPPPPPAVRILTSNAGFERQPSYSPDGSQVAFVWDGPENNNPDIYVKFVDAEGALRLTTSPALDAAPAWSPDGKWIAFFRREPNRPPSIWLISPLGGSERKLMDEWPLDSAPANLGMNLSLSWSPDGRWLAFSCPIGEYRGIYLLPSSGGAPKRIWQAGASAVDVYPTFSPDGRWLAFARCPRWLSCDVFSQKLNGGTSPSGPPIRLTHQELHIYGLAWVGDAVIYAGSKVWASDHYLWRVPANGSAAPERIDLAGRCVISPNYSARAHRLAFARLNKNVDIWMYSSSGGHRRFISSSLDEATPQFSPDGRRIVFASNRAGEGSEIYLSDADGSHLVQLTDHIGRTQGSPKWAPGGEWIAFDSLRPDGGQDIYLVSPGGGPPRRLELGPFMNALPNWSRDGNWIYYLSDRSGAHEIWKVASTGGTPQRVSDGGGFNAWESMDGKTLYYTKVESNTPLYAMPSAGGRPGKLLDGVGVCREFPVFSDGIYYCEPAAGSPVRLSFYEFSTGRSRPLTVLEGNIGPGLSVSPDRKSILYTKSLTRDQDLYEIDNFR